MGTSSSSRKPIGFTARVGALLGILAAVALVTLSLIGYQRITDINAENSAIRIDRAARAATQLTQETTAGSMTVVNTEAGSPLRIDLADADLLVPRPEWDVLVDRIAAMNEGAANLFVFDTETGGFDRISTSFKRPDGSRAGDSTREPGIITEGHPAYDDIAAGRPHTGPVPVMDRLRLAYLTPVYVDGDVAGALAVDVGWVDALERINGEARNQVIVITVLLVVLAGLVTVVLSITAFRPLRQLTGIANRLGRGERVPDIPLTDRGDEIGTLARGLARVDELQSDLMHLAYHDDLTGLPNRFDLFVELGKRFDSLTDDQRFAVMHIDLDDFGSINQALGHPVGDAVLINIAEELKSRSGPGDYVARSGGDEFTVISRPMESLDDARQLADSVREAVEAGSARAVTFAVTPSTGIVMAPDHADDAEMALAHAEIALGHAGHHEPGAVTVFESHMADSSLRRRRLTSDLRQVLAGDGLDIHVQPQYDLSTGRMLGMEALARWNHPDLGPIAPPEFIGIAESAGLITDLGAQILDTSCAFLRRWVDSGNPAVSMSVNVSPIQLWSPGFFETVTGCIDRHHLDPTTLCLELTESVLVDHADGDLRVLLERITSLGVRVAIDDFGTGYSSLSYLHTLPFHELKIDRSFIVGRDGSTPPPDVVTAIVDLGHALGLSIVAEGIEDEAGLSFVRAAGCDSAQGYLFARPMPTDAALSQSTSVPDVLRHADTPDTPTS